MSTVWRGWIKHTADDTRETAADFLKGLGITVGGEYIPWERPHGHGDFDDCIVPEEALIRLQPHWGRFVWGLEKQQQ